MVANSRQPPAVQRIHGRCGESLGASLPSVQELFMKVGLFAERKNLNREQPSRYYYTVRIESGTRLFLVFRTAETWSVPCSFFDQNPSEREANESFLEATNIDTPYQGPGQMLLDVILFCFLLSCLHASSEADAIRRKTKTQVYTKANRRLYILTQHCSTSWAYVSPPDCPKCYRQHWCREQHLFVRKD